MMKKIWLIIFLAIVLFFNLYFRSFSVDFPQLKFRAKENIKQQFIDEAVDEVNKKFPEYDAIAKDSLINKLIQAKNKQDKKIINSLINTEYLRLKDPYQNVDGQTYLMELDCWHWARYVENVVYLGHPGDKVVNGNQIDELMDASIGGSLAYTQLLFYSSAFLYRLFSFVNPVPLFTFLFYLPLFFSAIFIISLYLVCYYRWGNICAVTACLFVGLSPVFINRSYAGWFDMDTLSLTFPLLIVWAYAKNYDVQGAAKKTLWICFSGLCVSLFAATWLNWWFIFGIISIYEIYSFATLVFAFLKSKTGGFVELKQRIFSFVLFLFFSFAWIFVFLGGMPIKILYAQVFGSLFLNKSLGDVSIWPNVYFTVEELGKLKFDTLSRMIGDKYLLFFSVFCLLILAVRVLFKRKYTGFPREFISILIFWFITMFFACSRGLRFVLFLIIPLGVASGVIIQEAYEYCKGMNRKVVVLPAAIIIGLLLGNCFINAYETAEHLYPMMRDSDYKILSLIKEKTPESSVINSWWDYGDWFKVVSRRRVIFDGQSQNTPQAYWMAYVLLNSDEEKALKILRMLNNGGNKAYEVINGYFNDPVKTILFLKKIISSQPWIAKDVLKKSLPPEAASEATALLFNTPAKAYFIVDASIKDKIGAISYVGEWDFVRVYIAQNIHKKSKDEIKSYLSALSVDPQKIEPLYNEAGLIPNAELNSWFTRWLRFKSELVFGKEKGGLVLFEKGIVYNPKEKNVYVYSSKSRKYEVPFSVFIFENDKLEEIIYPDNDLKFSVLILKKEQGYQAILLDRKLATSLFVKLFYFDGAGLKNFKPFLEEQNKNGYFKVFEIVWN